MKMELRVKTQRIRSYEFLKFLLRGSKGGQDQKPELVFGGPNPTHTTLRTAKPMSKQRTKPGVTFA